MFNEETRKQLPVLAKKWRPTVTVKPKPKKGGKSK